MQCPLCDEHNTNNISIRPPTAGIRILNLEGEKDNKLAMWQFLKDLQHCTGLPLTVREQFDVAFGSDIGKSILSLLDG